MLCSTCYECLHLCVLLSSLEYQLLHCLWGRHPKISFTFLSKTSLDKYSLIRGKWHYLLVIRLNKLSQLVNLDFLPELVHWKHYTLKFDPTENQTHDLWIMTVRYARENLIQKRVHEVCPASVPMAANLLKVKHIYPWNFSRPYVDNLFILTTLAIMYWL